MIDCLAMRLQADLRRESFAELPSFDPEGLST